MNALVGSLASLVLPLVLGAIATRTGRFAGREAQAGLNAYALLVALPMLVLSAWLAPGASLGLAEGVLAVVGPLAALGATVFVGGRHRAGVALVALFGNTGFLGLPLLAALFGAQAVGAGSVAVALHVSLCVGLGYPLARRWLGGTSRPLDAWALVLHPLVGSLLLGVGLRALVGCLELGGSALISVVLTALRGVGVTAGPVGLFVLGVFLASRPELLAPRRGVLAWRYLVVRLGVSPLATLVAAKVLVVMHATSPDAAMPLILLASLPSAISTFAMADELAREAGAEDSGLGPDVAQAIVSTHMVALISTPCFLALGRAWL